MEGRETSKGQVLKEAKGHSNGAEHMGLIEQKRVRGELTL